MNLTLTVPPKFETELTGYRGSLKKTYYGKEYDFKFSDGEYEVFKDGVKFTKSDIESGKVPVNVLTPVLKAAYNYNFLN